MTSEQRNDGLSSLLKDWEGTAGRMSPGGVEPAFLLDHQTLDDLYRTNHYAQRMCDALPDEATRKWLDVSYGEGIDGDPIGEELWRLRLQEVLNRAAKLARKDGNCAVYIHIEDGRELSQPVDLVHLQAVSHLTVIERDFCIPHTWESDFRKPGFGEPVTYLVTPYSPGGSFGPVEIHENRLLMLSGKRLSVYMKRQNGYYDDSVLQRCWRIILDFRRAERDIGAIIRSFSTGKLVLPGLEAILEAGGNQAALERLALVNRSIGIGGLALLGEGEDLDYATRNVSGMGEMYDRLAQGIAAAAEMPLTLLFGHAPSGLSTDDESGRTNWYSRVASYQKNELRPHIEKVVRYLCKAQKGPLKGVEPEAWDLKWHPLLEQTEQEIVDLRSKQATTDEAYLTAGVLTKDEVRASRFGRGFYSLETTLQAVPSSPQDGQTDSEPAKYQGISWTPPQAVRAAYRRGTQLHEGKTGEGIEPITVRTARSLARGEATTPEWAAKAARWWGRNERFLDEPKDSPAYASAMLWGGPAGRDWWRSLSHQMEEVDKQ
jgi:uncharacterized protein